MSDRAPQAPGPGATSTRGRTGRETARLILVIGLTALVAVFAVLNTGSVEVNWIFGTFETPLILVILICLALGFLAGAGVAQLSARRSRRAAAARTR
jgi:uncharacterized integral membrane protein